MKNISTVGRCHDNEPYASNALLLYSFIFSINDGNIKKKFGLQLDCIGIRRKQEKNLLVAKRSLFRILGAVFQEMAE